MTTPTRRSHHQQLKPLAAALVLALGGQAAANPNGATVVRGNVSINHNGNTMTVTNSPGAIINWQNFSIASGEITRFIQRSSSSTVLNRVTGSDPSSILGTLQSNGHVWLINPNGVIFGQGARVDVAGLVASSLNVSNQDFADGLHRFTGSGGEGAVKNAGNISAHGGPVLLFAPNVENSGVIAAPNGEIILAAGHSVELADSTNPALRVTVTAGGEAINLGRIISQGGSIGMVGGLVRQAGVISASSATAEGGRIFLRGERSATLDEGSVTEANGTSGGQISAEGDALSVSGVLSAAGSQGAGGEIHALGKDVTLAGATLDAGGSSAGGTVLVGGDYQGENAAIRNARSVSVDAGSRIDVSAGENGDGGKAVVWSDGHTEYLGTILARGGVQGGDGGMVEVSGKETLYFRGMVDAGASAGKNGTLLLDPKNIIIGTIAGDVSIYNAIYGIDPAIDYALVPGQITSILNTGTDVTLQANNDITVTSPIIVDNRSGNGGSLTLQAGRSIMVNANISTDNGALYLYANDNAANSQYRDAGAAEITIASGVTIDTGTGTLEMNMGTLSTVGAINGAGTLVSGGLYISSDSDLTLNGQFNFSGGDAWAWAVDDINLNADIISGDASRTLSFMSDTDADGNGMLNVIGSGTSHRLLDVAGGEVLVGGIFNVQHALDGGSTFMLDVEGGFNQAGGVDITGFGHVGIRQLTGNLTLGNIIVDVPAGGYNPSTPAGIIALEALAGNVAQQSGTTLSGAGIGVIASGSVQLTEANPTGVVLGQAGGNFHFNSTSPIQVVSYDDGNYAYSGIDAGNNLSLTSTTSDITINAPVWAGGSLDLNTPTRTVINSAVYTGSSYANDGIIKVGAGGHFVVDGTFTNSGELLIDGGDSYMLVYQDFINSADGTVTVQSGGGAAALVPSGTYAILDIDGTLTNAGALTLDGYGSELIVFQGASNEQGGVVNVQNQGYFVSDGGVFRNSGNFTVSNSYAYFMAGVDNAQSGVIEVNGSNSGFYSVGPMSSAGTIALNNGYLMVDPTYGSTLTMSGGTLKGNGSIYGNVVNNGGTITPGNSAGALSFLGDLTLGGGSTLAMELGDPANASANDQLYVSGLFTMGGALQLSAVGGYTPAVGDSFTLYTAGSEAGSFASISLPLTTVSLSGGLLQILSESGTTTAGTTISQVIVDSTTQVSTGTSDIGLLFTVTPLDEGEDDKKEGRNSTRMICS